MMALVPEVGRRRQADFCEFKNSLVKPGMVAHAFNPGTREAEAGRFQSSRPAYKVSYQDSQD